MGLAPSPARVATEPFDDLDRRAPAELARWWRQRIRRVLRIAYAELPFYQRRFRAAGFEPGRFRTLEDLAALPRLTKQDLVDATRAGASFPVGLERGAADGPGVIAASSGTQGTSFLALPPRWRREQGRSSLRAHWWAGLRPGAPFLLSAPAWHTYATVQTWIAERLGLPCAVVAGTYLPRFAERIVDALLTFRPRFVTLFLPMVFSLVGEAERRGIGARELFDGVETLVVTGAPITPGMRDHLRERTGVARVVELAGSSENLLAVECAVQQGLHVVPDTCYVEVVDSASGRPVAAGERGSVVHTALVPWGSLYLRFDGGDVGVLDERPCPCGLPSPRVKLLGRAADAFVLGGRRLLPWDVQRAVEQELPELAGVAFAILREEIAAGRLALVLPRPSAAAGSDAPLGEALATRLRRRFDAPVAVHFASALPLLFKGVPGVVGRGELA